MLLRGLREPAQGTPGGGFEVVLSVLRPEGAATNQPRASPWDPGDPPPSPALNGRHTEAGAGKERAWTALSGLAVGGNPHHPRAVPWADLWRPLRGEISQAQLQNWRVGFVWRVRNPSVNRSS